MIHCQEASLALRPIRHKDVSALYGILTHPEVSRYNDYALPSNPSEVQDIIQGDIELLLTGEGVRMAIVYQEQVVGSCGIYDAHTKVAKIGYELHPLFWGQGLMHSALSLLLSEGQQYMGADVTTIQAQVHMDNLRSIKLLQRLGFVCSEPGVYQLPWLPRS